MPRSQLKSAVKLAFLSCPAMSTAEPVPVATTSVPMLARKAGDGASSVRPPTLPEIIIIFVAACAVLVLISGWVLFYCWLSPRRRSRMVDIELQDTPRDPPATESAEPQVPQSSVPYQKWKERRDQRAQERADWTRMHRAGTANQTRQASEANSGRSG